VHYPKLITEQSAFMNRYDSIDTQIPVALTQRKRILSLPIHHHLDEEQISYVAQILRTLHD